MSVLTNARDHGAGGSIKNNIINSTHMGIDLELSNLLEFGVNHLREKLIKKEDMLSFENKTFLRGIEYNSPIHWTSPP